MPYTIYLSSTLKDLDPERAAVLAALAGRCVVKQSYTANESSLIQSCLDDVATCDLYVGVVALRYGYIPADAQNLNNLSITHLEYLQAVEKNLPRLIFLKSAGAIVAMMTDAYSGEHPKQRIENFRTLLNEGQRPAEFTDSTDLKFKVAEAFNDFTARRERKVPLLGATTTHPSELVSDVAIFTVKGTDDTLRSEIQAQADRRFTVDELSPDDPRYVFELDRRIRTARSACLLITAASLSRFLGRLGLVEAILTAMADRLGTAFLLLHNLTESDLPAEWTASSRSRVLKLGPDLQTQTAAALARIYGAAREHSAAIANDRRIGIPCLVIALTKAEAERFAADPEATFAGLGALAKQARRKQYDDLLHAVTVSGRSWPADFYGASREGWRPFGVGKSGAEVLQEVIERVNADQRPGSRERRLLRDYRLQPQRYCLDDYRIDRFGSRAMLEDVRDRGCLVLLDEFALLHPAVRHDADQLLSGQRVAVVSANPCDPAHYSTKDLLDEFSYLDVGSLFERFSTHQDPRCELSLNSQARLERWLRLMLPELVSMLGHEESQSHLVAKASELLAERPPQS